MKNKKLLMRLLCALLSLLMIACMLPAMVVSADDGAGTGTGDGSDKETDKETPIDHTMVFYESAEARFAAMTPYYNDGSYELRCDTQLGIVGYKKIATGEILFTNPWDMKKEPSSMTNVRQEMMSQIILSYVDSQGRAKTLTSYADAILKNNQHSVTPIKGGVRVEYAMGETSARILVPLRIEEQSFREKIMAPLQANLSTRDFNTFMAYYSLKKAGGSGIAAAYPVTEKKGINIYVYNDDVTSTKTLRKLEAWILAYCPDYSFAQMDDDYELVEFQQEATSPPVFRMALEYTVDANGLSVSLPANGLRYDETSYRITNFQLLPYMGASYKGNKGVDAEGKPIDGDVTYSGYSFLPDASGAIYALDQQLTRVARVYGEDYALLSNIAGFHTEPVRMPVYGQVETATKADGTTESRGFFAIIEEGESLASISSNHSLKYYSSIIPSFITRQTDTSKSSWTVYANRRYTQDYTLRFIILSDDAKAAKANLSSYYECSWMGMACAYRDYLSASNESFKRLTAEDVSPSIPLYIETFGCLDTVKKILSVPVTVSVALTSFEDVQSMYEYLLGENVSNVNFKLTGYANGGLYSEVPYKLKWQGSVGGKSGFKDLVKYAAEHPELGIFPDFDFVYTQGSGTSVNMKKYAARTVDNRYTAKRVYSATQQTLVSYYQMVLSPATFDHFYEKLEKKYAKYGNLAISLSTLGSDLNSDFNEEKTSLREDSKNYTIAALNYFSSKGYDVMVDSGNAYSWGYADHILDVPLDSNRYNDELSAVPFMGVVLHGYVEFAGSAFNMEGNLTYAMLKAMENGAGVYFVLSYANTELLKEDELLSQNYSVRYDIWQKRLVEIYNELNAVLADVQTKLIVDHQFLDGVRVPDEDELLADAYEAAQQAAAAVKEKLAKETAALDALQQVENRFTNYLSVMAAQFALINAQRTATSALSTAWAAAAADKSAANVSILMRELSTYAAEPLAKLYAMRTDMDKLLAVAKENYNFLATPATGTEADVVTAAGARLGHIIDLYVQLLDRYNGTAVTALDPAVKNAYVANLAVSEASALGVVVTGKDAEVPTDALAGYFAGTVADYDNIGADNIEIAISVYLNATGLGNDVPFSDLINSVPTNLVVKPAPTTPVQNTTVTTNKAEVSSKYAVDSEIVKVTYGESKADPYKTLILNFNDYAIQTVVDGVIYNIDAYDYVVIMHKPANS